MTNRACSGPVDNLYRRTGYGLNRWCFLALYRFGSRGESPPHNDYLSTDRLELTETQQTGSPSSILVGLWKGNWWVEWDGNRSCHL